MPSSGSGSGETTPEVTSALGVLQNLAGSQAPAATTAATPVQGETAKTGVRTGTVLAAATGRQACKMKRGGGACVQRPGGTPSTSDACAVTWRGSR